jgi:chitinase
MSIGGWSFSKHFSDALASESKRQTFVNGIIAILKNNHGLFDVVDIDWEHIRYFGILNFSPPGQNYGNSGNATSPHDGANFAQFIYLLRQNLDLYSSAIEITACVTGNPGMMSALPIAEMACYLDAINIMTYDFSSSSWGDCLAGHHTNLYSTPYASLSVDKAVEAYLNAGFPASKIVIGAALYSRGFANTSGLGHASSGLVSDKSWEGNLG